MSIRTALAMAEKPPIDQSRRALNELIGRIASAQCRKEGIVPGSMAFLKAVGNKKREINGKMAHALGSRAKNNPDEEDLKIRRDWLREAYGA